MLKNKQVTVYEWDDIKAELCRRLGIGDAHFRDLKGKFIGEVYDSSVEYCDLWHIALDVFIPDHMSNGSTVTMYSISDIDYYCESMKEEGKEWAIPMLQAYNDIMREIDPNDNGVEVKFWW